MDSIYLGGGGGGLSQYIRGKGGEVSVGKSSRTISYRLSFSFYIHYTQKPPNHAPKNRGMSKSEGPPPIFKNDQSASRVFSMIL